MFLLGLFQNMQGNNQQEGSTYNIPISGSADCLENVNLTTLVKIKRKKQKENKKLLACLYFKAKLSYRTDELLLKNMSPEKAI